MAIKKGVSQKPRKSPTGNRKRLTPAKASRGPAAPEIPVPIDSAEISPLAELIRARGGAPIGAYREPLSGKPILLATLPLNALEPTPFQRDLSPTHTKRLADRIRQSGCFLDPLIVVPSADGGWWTPNGRHRLAAAKILGLRQVTVLVSPDESLSFRILALNTEKAHNLRDRSLEVIRMARELAARQPRAHECDFADQFEAPELITLGIIYAEDKRFSGGAYQPFLRKVDRFSERGLAASLSQRENWAARLSGIDAIVKNIIAELQRRGFQSPYLRHYVVARINPVRFHRAKKGDDKPPMPLPAALIRMAAAAKQFDTARVNPAEIALVAAVAE
ncbi:MAG: ParB N-terminal domain-containing protein [Verrucomicrobiae bacterium]|nr:ParB N-terminal domain-containing protein [Verrucomicrobiae bacterium]